MRRFFQGRSFKSIALAVCILLVVSIVFGAIGKRLSPQSDFLGAILVPILKSSNSLANGVDSIFTAVGR
ncbi:MAG: hypothetical protein IKM39_03625, partial [Clostridia bacterium]|nr:hypothetical protein [Clostridia bacterium]